MASGEFAAAARARPTSRLGPLGATAFALEMFLGLGAIGGGIALMMGPCREILPLPVSALRGSPFADYFVPGLVLFGVLGIGSFAAAILACRRHRLAPVSAFVVGCALLIWLAVEIAVVGYSGHPPLQAVYLGLGVVIASLGLVWTHRSGAPAAS